MNQTVSKATASIFATFLALGTFAAEPTISDVVVRQRWPWSRLVDIDYVLTCDASQSVDIRMTAKDGSNTLTLPVASLAGDLYSVSHGPHRIVWDPTVTSYTNSQMLTQFSVTLTPVDVPLYMIVDLTKGADADGQIAYVYESDLTNGLWGAWERNPVTNQGAVVESVIWTGVATNDIYKTDKLVLRRMRAGAFGMGSSASLSTTLTRDFYAGVFEVTQYQWDLFMPVNTSYFSYYAARPMEELPYNIIRGATTNTPAINWPTTGFAVLPSSFMGQLRAGTGMVDFDLPTEAQWEYFCRAGTSTFYNDGLGTPANTASNAQLNVLGRYQYNVAHIGTVTGNCTPDDGAALAGSYLPNAWGLYDTHGNVREYCLDWEASLTGGSDPKGPDSGTYRINRGGSWNRDGSVAASADRTSLRLTPDGHNGNVGFRLVRHLQ